MSCLVYPCTRDLQKGDRRVWSRLEIMSMAIARYSLALRLVDGDPLGLAATL